MAYTEEDKQGFRTHDLVVGKSELLKAFLAKHGVLPTPDQMDTALKLIYTFTPQDWMIVRGELPGQTPPPDKPF